MSEGLDEILDREFTRAIKAIESGRFTFLKKLSRSRIALLTIAAAVVLVQLRDMPLLLATMSLDAAIAAQKTEPSSKVRLVTIDDEDYATLFHARSPLDPAVLAGILAAVERGRPSAVVVDIDTSDPAFKTLSPPAAPILWNVSGAEQAEGKFVIESPLGGQPLPPGSAIALAVAPLDDRGVVRGYQRSYALDSGGFIASPGAAAAQVFAGRPPAAVGPPNGVHYLDFRYRIPAIKARDLLQNAATSAWDQLGFFQGQVVVIGGAYHAARDQYATPRGLLNGCEVVAQSVAAEIDGTYISPASRLLTGILMVAGGLVVLTIYNYLPFRVATLLSLLLVPLLSMAYNWILFRRLTAWGAMIPMVIAVIVAELYSKATLYLAFYERIKDIKKKHPPTAPAVTPAAAPAHE